MRQFVEFMKTTIMGGFFVALPVVLVILVLDEMISIVRGLILPFAELLPVEQIGCIAVAKVIAVLFILVFCFLMGLLMRTRIGTLAGEWLEKVLLTRLPAYGIIKGLTQRMAGGLEGAQFAPAVVDLYGSDARVPAMIVDEHDDGHLTVFVPLSPTPTIGQVYKLPNERVQATQASLPEVLDGMMRWGIDSRKLFDSDSKAD